MQASHIARVKLERDGTVLLTTDGVETGQGLHIKAIQMASGTLGRALQVLSAGTAPRVPFRLIRVTETDSSNLSNLGLTGQSAGVLFLLLLLDFVWWCGQLHHQMLHVEM